MPNDPEKKPFSKRHGYKSKPKEITIWKHAPEALRYEVLTTTREIGYTPYLIREVICKILRVRPDENNRSEYPNIWEEAQSHVYGCEWFKFYDFVEKLYERMARSEDDSPNTGYKTQRDEQKLAGAFNEFCVDEGIGWQLKNGRVVARGSESFESNTSAAVEALESSGRKTASSEMHEALRDLSRRPEPDLTGAIQHSIAALECVARDICGDARATLGDIIKRYPDTIPKPLDASIEKAWGARRGWRGT